MDEFQIIAEYFKPLADSEGAYGLMDDVAVLASSGDTPFVVTTDALVEGVHFLPTADLADVGYKLAAVNVSDCLAKGAVPRTLSLVLAIPTNRRSCEIGAFAAGLAEGMRAWKCTLIGGDTIATPGPFLAALTVHGQCIGDAPVRRCGARDGDDLWVTGTIGDACLGLLVAKGELARTTWTAPLEAAYNRPVLPPLVAADMIADHASSAIDVSDGLLADAEKLAAQSGLAIEIESERIPLSDAARRWQATQTRDSDRALAYLVCGGDDYQILFTAPRSTRDALCAWQRQLPVTRIGTCRSGVSACLIGAHGRIDTPGDGWRHQWQS